MLRISKYKQRHVFCHMCVHIFKVLISNHKNPVADHWLSSLFMRYEELVYQFNTVVIRVLFAHFLIQICFSVEAAVHTFSQVGVLISV